MTRDWVPSGERCPLCGEETEERVLCAPSVGAGEAVTTIVGERCFHCSWHDGSSGGTSKEEMIHDRR